jgi:hypothetical protein
VKVQYFGDANDYRKFALLRLLSEVGGFRIGVCWMLTPDDGTGHGDKRSYLKQPNKWRRYDPRLFDALTLVPATPSTEDLRRIENEALISGAAFFNAITPDPLAGRKQYHAACMKELKACELIFLDPDIGLEIKTVVKGRKSSSRYAYLDEIADHYSAGRSVLLYQHFTRVPRETLVQISADRLRDRLAGSKVWAFWTPHVIFLLAAIPDHDERIQSAVGRLHQRGWVPELFGRVQEVPTVNGAT